MTSAHEPENVRGLVIQVFEQLGAAASALADLEETILIDDGKNTARSYHVQGWMAMWLIPIGVVQFYDAEGNMLATIRLSDEQQSLKAAA